MAKAGLLFVGTTDGLVLFSNPGMAGRWLRIGNELFGKPILALWAAPDNPLIVLAIRANDGLWRSANGGQSWKQVIAAAVTTITGNATSNVYVGDQQGKIWQSNDGGENWTVLVTVDGNVQGLVLHARGISIGVKRQIWFWGGEKLELCATLPAPVQTMTDLGQLYVLAGETLYVVDGTPQALRSAGTALAALPGNESVLLFGEPQRIARSSDLGRSWSAGEVTTGWRGTITVLVPAPYHMDTAFAGTNTGQIAVSSDRGRNWKILHQEGAAITSIAVGRLI
jgi:hypothetical protein